MLSRDKRVMLGSVRTWVHMLDESQGMLAWQNDTNHAVNVQRRLCGL